MVYRRRDAPRGAAEAARDLLRKSVVVWAVLAALAVFIAVTGLGIVPDRTGDWGLPAVALLEWQILLACVLCLAVMWAEASGRPRNRKGIDVWIAAAVWAGTALLWLSQPVNPGFSALEPRAPNFEIYPFFDAQVYDEHAQSILVGNGMQEGEIPSRPLYIVFLAALHLIAGQNYEHVIAAQSVVLALFPAALYLIGREIYGRPLGVAMALLAALRDVTSNFAAPFTYALTYSKLYLSEIPVAIPLVLFLILAMRWKAVGYPGLRAFVAGGVLGIAILIRTQAVVALPAVLVTAWLAERRRFAAIARGGVLMLGAVVVVTAPWIWRNWKHSGEIIFDSPQTQTINLALRYNALNGMRVDALRGPDESRAEYNDRLLRLFREAVAANPRGAVLVVMNRFLNNCINNILLFPLRDEIRGVNELVWPSHSFWERWRGTPTAREGALVAVYAALMGLGLAAAWKRAGAWGLAPMGVNLLYHLWTSLALLSGQRFLVSTDWVIAMYYMIGLFTLLSGFLYLLERGRPLVDKWYGAQRAPEVEDSSAPAAWPKYAAAGLAFLLVGASIPLSEMVLPKRYPVLTQQQVLERLFSSEGFRASGLDRACVAQAVEENGLIGSTGRALSPRYYGAGEGEPTAKLGYAESDEGRLLFLTTGNRYGLAILEMPEEPEFFPHAADVLLYADPENSHVAWLALVGDSVTAEGGKNRQALYVSDTAKQRNPCLSR